MLSMMHMLTLKDFHLQNLHPGLLLKVLTTQKI